MFHEECKKRISGLERRVTQLENSITYDFGLYRLSYPQEKKAINIYGVIRSLAEAVGLNLEEIPAVPEKIVFVKREEGLR